MITMRNPIKTLVCGGAGFLGYHLCQRLLSEGKEVICIDNFQTGRPDSIKHLLDNPRFKCVRHDVTEPLHVEVDQIYNFACPASPFHYQRDPITTTKASVLGAMHLLALAETVGARIVQASTSEVYGEPEVHPQQEDYVGHVNFTGPRSCYDEGKRCAETLFADYRRQARADARVARIFNTYGPGLRPDDGRVVCNFIVQSLRDEPITIYGDGRQTRSFCYVTDTIDAICRLMNLPGGAPGPVNIGNPDELTILGLAERVVALTGSRSRIEKRPLPADDPTRRRPDITRARELLGWKPQVSFDDGLLATIAYIESELVRAPRTGLQVLCEAR
jgi:UDP-glucuronate decarboxylase